MQWHGDDYDIEIRPETLSRVRQLDQAEKLYQACKKEKQESLMSPRSCESAMAEAGQPYPCSQMCPCNLRDAYIELFEMRAATRELKA